MANNNQIYKMSNAGGFKSLTRYYDMLAGNTTWNPWEPQGAYDSLATVTLAASASTITFAGIPTGYKHLQLRALMQQTGSGASEQVLRFNADSGSSYAWHQLYGDGASAAAAGSATQTGIGYAWSPQGGIAFGSVIVDILDYASTTKNKTTRSLNGWDRNGSGYVLLRSGLWMNTAAVTSITLTSTGTDYAQYSSFALYGVK